MIVTSEGSRHFNLGGGGGGREGRLYFDTLLDCT